MMIDTQLKVEGMSCGHCVRAVRETLEAQQGVKGAEVSLEQATAVVHHDESADVQAWIAALHEEGYPSKIE